MRSWTSLRAGSLAVVSLALALAATGCSAGSIAGGTGGPGPTPTGDGGVPVGGDCARDVDCAGGNVCRRVDGVLRCVPPGAITTDGGVLGCTDCSPPNECRAGICIAPDPGGAVCEFDPECSRDGSTICVSGRCTANPCPGGMCACMHTLDCPVGRVCTGGMCVPRPGGDGCIVDLDCPMGDLCEGGECIPGGMCTVVNPDLAGTWNVTDHLPLGDALPGLVSGLLGAGHALFDFFSGSDDFGLPGFIASIVRDTLRGYLPPWVFTLLDFLAEADDVLRVWNVTETWTLMPTTVVDHYRGHHDWRFVEFTYRGRVVRADPATLGRDWSVLPDDFDAAATCGVLVIDRHDLNVDVRRIILWLLDTMTYELSDHAYLTLADAMSSVATGFCDEVDYIATGVDSILGAVARGACESTLSRLIDDLIRELTAATIGMDVTIKGHVPIVSSRSMTPGVWEGTFAGGDFVGDFTASR